PALYVELAPVLETEAARVAGRPRGFRDQDPGHALGRAFDATAEVHGVADRGVLHPRVAAKKADDRRPGVKADADVEIAQLGLGLEQLGTELVELAAHLQRRRDRAVGVVGYVARRVPEGHDRVADELVEGAAVAEDHI